MRVILLRHGATAANDAHLYCGRSDPGLSASGRSELFRLKSECVYPKTDGLHIITSGMRRADETLAILYDRVPESRNEGLIEMNFGLFELHGYEELKTDPAYIRWIEDETGDVPTPGGESANAFHARVLRAFDAIDVDSLIVCHGGVISTIMARLFPDEGRHFYQWQPAHGCGYEINIGADGSRTFRPIPELRRKEGYEACM